MNTPLTQSTAWAKLQTALGETHHTKDAENYHYLAIQKSTPLGPYLYLPYGPVAKDSNSLQQALSDLTSLAKQQGAFFVRIEPQLPAKDLQSTSVKLTKSHDLNPADTWVLDLPKLSEADRATLPKTLPTAPLTLPASLKDILPSRLFRYYKSTTKKGFTLRTSKDPADLQHLLRLQSALADRKNINTFDLDYYTAELAQPFSTLYLLEYTPVEGDSTPVKSESKVVAAGLVFDDKSTRYNLQGAQDPDFAKQHATGILTIQLILDAAQKGLKVFDFWGIAPDGAPADHPWQGFTKFKQSFPGHAVHYAGTWDLVVNPAKYRAYQLLRTANRLRRKL